MAVVPPTAEEFYSQSLERLHLLNELARGHAERHEILEALVTQWAADIVTVQAAAWERIVVVSRTAHRSLFDLGERMLNGLVGETLGSGVADAAGQAQFLRRALVASLDEDLAAESVARFASIDYLVGLPAPSMLAMSAMAQQRLGGLDPADFIAARLEGSRAAMSRSHAARVRGEISPAIEAAYESDMLALDAYLVDSAIRLGDDHLLSAFVRWELAAAAISRLGSVPSDVFGAAQAVRDAIGTILGVEERERLGRVWQPLK